MTMFLLSGTANLTLNNMAFCGRYLNWKKTPKHKLLNYLNKANM